MSRAAGWAVAESRCADDAGAPPLWPWTQVFEQLARTRRAGGRRRRRRRRRRPVPALPGRARPAGRAAAGRPVLVVLDDLQGADATSVQLLALLARHLPRVPLLVVVTVRSVGEDLPEAVGDCLAGCPASRPPSRSTLAGLAPDDVGSLLAAQLGHAATPAWPRRCTTAPPATRSSSSS
jgi:hypothetical protein